MATARRIISIIVLCVAATAAVAEDVQLTEEFDFFSVYPDSVNDLGPALLAAGRKQALGPAAIAETLSRHNWSLDMTADNRACSVSGVSVTLEVIYRMPKVVSDDDDINARWETLYPRILKHERQHKDIAYEVSQEILAALNALRPATDCDALVETANAIVDRLHTEERRRQRAFDKRTIGGETEGIIRFEVYE